MNSFELPIPKRLITRILLVFWGVGLFLIGMFFWYWQSVLVFQIRDQEQAKVDLLAPIYARQIALVMDKQEQKHGYAKIEELIEHILLSADPSTGKKLFAGVEVEWATGEKPLARLPKPDFSGFISEALIVSATLPTTLPATLPTTLQKPLGLVRLYYSGDFFEHLLEDSEKKLLQAVVVIVLLLALAWLLLVVL